jgi:hypothetical protein
MGTRWLRRHTRLLHRSSYRPLGRKPILIEREQQEDDRELEVIGPGAEPDDDSP